MDLAAESREKSPLFTGKLALPVDRSELVWGVEEQDDGRRLLCIELPLAPADPRNTKRVDSIFDESLTVNGEPCLAPGLSQGKDTAHTPPGFNQ